MSEELLPCPFVAVRRTLLSGIAVIIHVATVKWDIGCETEGCIVWDGLGYFQTKES